MSSPTTSFSRLSLSRMPTTRAAAGKLQLSRPDPVASDDEDSTDDEDSNDDPGEDSSPEADEIIRSIHTKLRYDTRLLSPTTEERAKAGLKEPFTLGHCSLYNPSQSNEYYAFQIFETVNFSVRIGAPDSEYRELTCHCDNDPRPCRHVFWLMDQIAQHTLSDAQKSSPLPLTKRGITSDSLDTYRKISSARPRLFQELDCELRTDTDYDEPESTADAAAERIKDVRDLLASLSPVTRDEYRPDIFDALPAAADQPQLFPGDLEKTLAHALLANDDLFRHLRALVPASHCATDFFLKQRAAAAAALASLDAYIAAARPAAPPSPAPVHDIPWAAAAVAAAVAAIAARVHEARAPLSLAARHAAAEGLCRILRALAARDADVYAGAAWAGTRQQALPLRERNLFVRLFGGAPAAAAAAGGRAVVDGIVDLGDAARPFVQLLEEAAEGFRESGALGGWVGRIEGLVGGLKGGEGAGGGGGGSKRAGPGGEGRGRKRMK